MHGQHERNTRKEPVDKKQSYAWLKARNITGETESIIIAVQEQAMTKLSQK